VNPFARKKWVNKRIDPLKDQLNELDEVNARNSRDIKDVDGRAQAGIRTAQSAADAANQAALAADGRAHSAGTLAQGASGHVDQLNTTVAGLDQYSQTSEVEVAFRGGQPILSVASRKKLDDLATSVVGHQGYILDMEAHSPAALPCHRTSDSRLPFALRGSGQYPGRGDRPGCQQAVPRQRRVHPVDGKQFGGPGIRVPPWRGFF
jgi:hypothetical protein